MTTKKTKQKKSRREIVVAVLMTLCVLLIAGWEIAARLAARPFDELRLKSSDFADFRVESPLWRIRLVHTMATPTEPTAVAYELRRKNAAAPAAGATILSRIVHGYNMVDCMRIKSYQVGLIIDSCLSPAVYAKNIFPQTFADQLGQTPMQVWRLTSSSGKVAIWATTMLRAADFAATTVDTRDMAFPRVGTPDDPAWQPTGIKLSSFRHPIKNSRNAIRSRWNASRCDLPTFLRLRQPAWASNEMLTFVTEYHGPSVTTATEKDTILFVIAAHKFMLNQFQNFWHKHKPDTSLPQTSDRSP